MAVVKFRALPVVDNDCNVADVNRRKDVELRKDNTSAVGLHIWINKSIKFMDSYRLCIDSVCIIIAFQSKKAMRNKKTFKQNTS